MKVCMCMCVSRALPVSKFLPHRIGEESDREYLAHGSFGQHSIPFESTQVSIYLEISYLFWRGRCGPRVPYFGNLVTSDQSSISTKTCNFDFSPRFHPPLRQSLLSLPRPPFYFLGSSLPHGLSFSLSLRLSFPFGSPFFVDSFALYSVRGALNLKTCVHIRRERRRQRRGMCAEPS